MKKYLSILKISIQQEFAYRLNFVLWRIQNIIQILVFFFIWDAAFSGQNTVLFGYNKTQIFTYAFVLVIVRAIVLSVRSNDIAGQIAHGELTNMLLKPVNYFIFWITRDVVFKFLNILFGAIEVTALIVILKPDLYFQVNPFYILGFILSLLIAIFIYFNILIMTSFIPFWIPEVAWGAQFLVTVVATEFLSGATFPIDVFPNIIYQILRLTPFPYLIFMPIKIYLGNFSYAVVFQNLLVGLVWCVVLWKTSSIVWKRGLKVYQGTGR